MMINTKSFENKKVTYFVGASGITNLPSKYRKVEDTPSKKPSFLPKKPLNDESLMPWGKFEGKKLADVPASYLLKLHESGKLPKNLKTYIVENFETLLQESESNYFKSTFESFLKREIPFDHSSRQFVKKSSENLINHNV